MRGMRLMWAVALMAAVGAMAVTRVSAEGPTTTAVQKAQAEYEAAVTSAREIYLQKLDAALKQAMQAGDLDEANRIDAVRKALRGDGASVSAGGGGNATGKSDPAEARQKPGWVVGRIMNEADQPIKGVEFEVDVYGTTLKGGEKSSFHLDVDANGRFAQELPDGLYSTIAYIHKDYAGSRFRIQLHPLDEKPEPTKLPSKNGIVKDFVWKLTGVRPGDDAKWSFAHYGSCIWIYDSHYLGEEKEKLTAKFPAQTRAVLTLTPKGPLIDGSKGAPLEVKTSLVELADGSGHVAMDIPIGSYTVEAKVVTPDGKSTPLNCGTEMSGPFKPKAEFVFKQRGIYDDITKVSIYVNP